MSNKNASPHLKRQAQYNQNLNKRARQRKKYAGSGAYPKPGVRPISIMSMDHPMRKARSEEEWRDALANRDRSKWQ